MAIPLRFLVIDDNCDSRALLTRTLLRKYPDAVIHERERAEAAVAVARTGELNAIVTHRTFDHDGVELVRVLRAANPTVPIVMVSGMDRAKDAVAAGADKFLSYEEWLRIGNVVGDLLAQTRSPFPPEGTAAGSPQSQPA